MRERTMSWTQVTDAPRERPLLVYDGDCGFCVFWVNRWRRLLGERIAFGPYQEVAERFPELPLERFRSAVQLIETDGTVTSGAEAVLRARAFLPGRRGWLWIYDNIPGARSVFEAGYRFVARHRPALYKVTKMALPREQEQVESGERRSSVKSALLPVAGVAAGAALLVWLGMRRKGRARGMSADRQRARELQRDWRRTVSHR
jgi:predicted DCC family thiol-disulfide oxidoreductase YuxK